MAWSCGIRVGTSTPVTPNKHGAPFAPKIFQHQMRVQFRASQLSKNKNKIGFSATLAVLQTRLPRPLKPQRAPTSCRSHQGNPPAPGPRCSVPAEDALSPDYLLLVQPGPDKHRGPTVCAWIRTCFVPGSAQRGGDGGSPRVNSSLFRLLDMSWGKRLLSALRTFLPSHLGSGLMLTGAG